MSMRSAKLGQHFLKSPAIIQRMVRSLPLPPQTVLEIGAGDGRLTKWLLSAGYQVTSYELDGLLFERSRTALGRYEGLTLRLGDGFTDLQRYDAFISSLPYYASRRFLEWFSGSSTPLGIVVLQKDFVDKISSPPGSRKYGAYSVLTSWCFSLEELFVIPPDQFEPRPKVYSCVVRLKRRRKLGNGKGVAMQLKALFSYRGRMVASVVRDFGGKGSWDGDLVLDQMMLRKRVEDLDPAEAMLVGGGLMVG